MRKGVLAGGIVLLCLAILALVVMWQRPAPPAPGVTLENFRRLHVGMTEAQVEAILGTSHDKWRGDGGWVWVYEGADRRVGVEIGFSGGEAIGGVYGTDVRHFEPLREKRTFLGWVRSWLPWHEPETPEE
jgi:hypothetical protein